MYRLEIRGSAASRGSSGQASVLPLQGAKVPSLDGELRSHMLHSTAKKLRKKIFF